AHAVERGAVRDDLLEVMDEVEEDDEVLGLQGLREAEELGRLAGPDRAHEVELALPELGGERALELRDRALRAIGAPLRLRWLLGLEAAVDLLPDLEGRHGRSLPARPVKRKKSNHTQTRSNPRAVRSTASTSKPQAR